MLSIQCKKNKWNNKHIYVDVCSVELQALLIFFISIKEKLAQFEKSGIIINNQMDVGYQLPLP